MSKLRVLILIYNVSNPLAICWTHGFSSLSYSVAVLIWDKHLRNKRLPTPTQLKQWGFKNDDLPEIPVFNFWDRITDDLCKAVIKSLEGSPDILFCWEGTAILKPLRQVHQFFSTAKIVHCVAAFPWASNQLSELRDLWYFHNASSLISSYVFYSEIMRKLFIQAGSSSTDKLHIIMIDPFPERAFASPDIVDYNVPHLERFDDSPHIIFTGRADRLWSKTFCCSRDAIGLFLKQLSQRRVHIFLEPRADTKGLPNLHLQPQIFFNVNV